MKNKERRPPDWDEIRAHMPHSPTVWDDYEFFEAGIKALIKWLFEPCTEHEYFGCPYCQSGNGNSEYPEHRKDCPVCIEQLKGE